MDSLNKSNAQNNHQLKVDSKIDKHISSLTNTTTFDYEINEDNEWDIEIGDLIIDLDADIEKSSQAEFSSHLANNCQIPLQTNDRKKNINNKIVDKYFTDKTGKMSSSSVNNQNKNPSKSDHHATLDKGLKMKIKRTKTGKSSELLKHEIVKSETSTNGTALREGVNSDELNNKKSNTPVSPLSASAKRGNNHKKEKEKFKEKSNVKQDVCNCTATEESPNCHVCTKKVENNSSISIKQVSSVSSSSNTFKNIESQTKIMDVQKNDKLSSEDFNMYDSTPPVKRAKCDPKKMIDVCVGTSVGTITEPENLGPCEPGTSVTLEGIVWHETEGGVLAVNVTWRGKTYIGTLIDCTKHDWAPPRFCDSPIDDIESRIQKTGRSKRVRNCTMANELLNFTETRTSVHSKLRAKVSKTDKRRKSKDENPVYVNGNNNGNNSSNSSQAPTIGSSNQVNLAKKPKNNTISICAVSPVLLECPEQDCSKKYKHANGLKYHQSHAHGVILNNEDDSAISPDSDSLLVPTSEKAFDCSELVCNNTDIRSEKSPSFRKSDCENECEDLTEHRVASSSNSIEPSNIPTSKENTSAVKSSRNITIIQDFEQISNDSLVENLQTNVSNHESSESKTHPKAIPNTKCKKDKKVSESNVEAANEVGNVLSPAYSDISDDSNHLDKSKQSDVAMHEAKSGLMVGNYTNMSFFQTPPNFENQATLGNFDGEMLRDHAATGTQKKEDSEEVPSFEKIVQHHHLSYSCSTFTSSDDIKPSSILKTKKESENLDIQDYKPPKINSESEKEGSQLNAESMQHSNLYANLYQRHLFNFSSSKEEDIPRYLGFSEQRNSQSTKNIKEENLTPRTEDNHVINQQQTKNVKNYTPTKLSISKDTKVEDKDVKVKQEGQKPTMETQGPPPPLTQSQQYYLPYIAPGGQAPQAPFFPDTSQIYRNMLNPYNSAYHLQMPRFSSPEDLSRNTNTKALDLLSHHASQYYNTHKIHELNERINTIKTQSNATKLSPIIGGGNSNSLPSSSNVPSVKHAPSSNLPAKNNIERESSDEGVPLNVNRPNSPPPQRHVHTHHHTHIVSSNVYPMYPAAYTNPAVTVINPFGNGQQK